MFLIFFEGGMSVSRKLNVQRSDLKEVRRIKTREEWAIENKAALTERCRLLESEGGTAAERLYGVLPSQET